MLNTLPTRSMLEIQTPHTLVLFIDEAWCHVSGYVRTRNNRYWSAGSRMVIEVASLNYRMVKVRCALDATRIIQPIFFLDHKHTPTCSTHFETIFEP